MLVPSKNITPRIPLTLSLMGRRIRATELEKELNALAVVKCFNE